MTLDPVASTVIRTLEQALPRAGTVPVEELRRRTRELSVVGEPVPVDHVEDVTFEGPAGELRARFYRPGGPEPLAVIVYLHGGGWAICDLDTHDGTCRSLARGSGCAVLSVDYRLAPEHPFPAAVEDAYASVCWAAANAPSLGVDAARLAVAGDSSGGNLAAVACLVARDRGGPSIALQVLIYPPTDRACATASYRENGDGYFLTAAEMHWYWEQYLGSSADGSEPYASPLRAADLSGLPPALIITAEHDPLRDEGEEYGSRLAAAGVPVTVTRYDSAFHGFFGMAEVLDAARRANDEVVDTLRRVLASSSTTRA